MPASLTIFFWAYTAALGASLIVAFIAYKAGLPQTRWNPLSDPLMGDLMEYPGTFQLVHTAAFFGNASPGSLPAFMFSAVAYPPLASVVLALLYVGAHPTCLFLAATLCWLTCALSYVWRGLLRIGLTPVIAMLLPITLTLTSFPIQRLIHQGNIELLVWVLAATGICAFVRQRHNLAAGLWGTAAAIKLYPLLLLILLASPRRYRALFFGCAVFLSTSWLSLWWLGPTTVIALKGSIRNVFGYQQLRTTEWSLRELVANHSAFTFAKLAAQITHTPPSRFTLLYYLFGAAVVLWAFFGRLTAMPVTNQVLAVTVCMLLLPTISYFHTLVHLYAPFLLLASSAIEANRTAVRVPGLQTTMLLFVPLFMPYTLFTFPHLFLFCGLVQSAVLGLLFLCALQYPFPDPTQFARRAFA